MWELDHTKGRVLKNWGAVVLPNFSAGEDSCEIQPVPPNGNQSWIFIGKTDAEAETPILWPPDAKSQLTGKDPDAGKDWRQEEKGTTEDETAGWRHWLDGHEFEQTLGDVEGQGSLSFFSPWGSKESDMTEWLSNNKNNHQLNKNGLSRMCSLWPNS